MKKIFSFVFFLWISASFAEIPVIKDGYPIFLSHTGFGDPLGTGPVLSDINGDGKLEIIQNADNKLFIIDYNGNILNGWPKETRYVTQQNASIGDINGDGNMDIVFRDREYFGSNSYIYAWNADGSIFNGFPFYAPMLTDQPKTPTLYDFNNDNALDILFSSNNYIFIIDSSANPLPGWPVEQEYRVQFPLIGKFENNGEMIITALCGHKTICFYKPDGAVYHETLNSPISGYSIMSYLVTDTDRNGKSELCLILATGDTTAVILYSLDTGILDGWPIYLGPMNFTTRPFSCADLDDDNKLEIIWTDHAGYLHIYKNNGATLPGLPVKPEGSTQSAIDPVIGDIDGDSDLEIFVDNNWAFNDSSHYHVYHHTGEEVSWSPLVIPGAISSNCPALGDIENDGSIEMFFMQFDPYGWDTYLWCYSIPEVPYSADRFPWAMHGHDPQHTFWYDHKYQPENYINNNNQFPDHFRIFPNYPNPFNPSTTISFELPKKTYTEINIYNLAGQLVQTLLNEVKPAGQHQIIWDAGNLPSGIYFYQIKVEDTAGSGVQTKKCILLK